MKTLKIQFQIIFQKINQIISKISFKYSYIFPFILSKLNINISDIDSLTQVFYAFFILSLIALLCFINVIIFMVVYIFIQKGHLEEKYPRC